ncbi:MAG TPA: hypothetical protein VGL45_09965 [Bradyrhizobium sp.]|jgi:hypothetical protein
MVLAEKLSKTLGEILALPAHEYYLWNAFYSLTPDDHVSVEDKLRKIFGRPKNDG